jgi:PAS domain-containing protein
LTFAVVRGIAVEVPSVLSGNVSPPAPLLTHRALGHRATRLPPAARAAVPYVAAVFLVAAATLLTMSVTPLQEKTSTILFFAAVVATSYIGGLGPALLAVILSCFAWGMFVIPPEYSFSIDSPSDAVRLTLFVFVAILSSSLYEQGARARRDLARQRARLDLALEAAQMGVWDYDLTRDEFWISPEMREIFDVLEKDFSPTYGGFLAFVHPDDRTTVVRTMTTAEQNASGYQLEYRILRRGDSTLRWIATRGRTIVDERGRAVRMIGLVIDVTDRRAAAAVATTASSPGQSQPADVKPASLTAS